MGTLAGESEALFALPENPRERPFRVAAAPASPPTEEPPAAAFSRAQALHAAGRLADAEALYRALLAREPGHIQAKHYLGVLAHQAGRHDDAIALIREAARLAPDDPGIQVNLAEALTAGGFLPDAEAALRLAIVLDPRLVLAHLNLAALLLRQGMVAESRLAARRALELAPGNLRARMLLEAARTATETPPDPKARAWMHFTLAKKLANRGRRTDAQPHLEAALRLRPDWPDAHLNYGTLLHEWDDLAGALAAYEQVIALKPDWPAGWCNRGITLHELGRHSEALAAFARAEALEPDSVLAHWNKGLVLLLCGRLEEGWPEYEWRWKLDGKQAFPGPAWDGDPLDGRTILIHSEQGVGDTLQGLRYLPLVRERGGKVLLACPPSLRRLLQGFPGIDHLLVAGDQPRFDVQAPLLGLPRLFHTTLETIPPPLASFTIPDAAASAAAQAVRHPPLPPQEASPNPPLPLGEGWGEGLKAGLVWAGDPRHKNDARRSIPLPVLAPLLEVPGIRWFSLQKGTAEAEIAATGFGAKIAPLGALLADYAETAAAVRELDLVITVDTSVAHLAGTLGTPVWLLLPFAPDWRWLIARADSPWYPSARLFRQKARSDWPGVVAEAAKALTAHTGITLTNAAAGDPPPAAESDQGGGTAR